MLTSTTDSSPASPLSALQAQFVLPRSRRRFDAALRMWAQEETALAEITDHDQLAQVLSTREYLRQDVVLFALLRRAAAAMPGDDGVVAAELVVNAMIPAIPGIVGRVIRASRAALCIGGTRRGVTGGGVSADERNLDVQAMVIGHLWEKTRCYPLRRRHHVAANLVWETYNAALRSLGISPRQAAAEVNNIDDDDFLPPNDQSMERAASEQLLELLSWAVEQEWLDDHAVKILVARYFGEQRLEITDKQLGAVLGLSKATVNRHRRRAITQLAAAARELSNASVRWAS